MWLRSKKSSTSSTRASNVSYRKELMLAFRTMHFRRRPLCSVTLRLMAVSWPSRATRSFTMSSMLISTQRCCQMILVIKEHCTQRSTWRAWKAAGISICSKHTPKPPTTSTRCTCTWNRSSVASSRSRKEKSSCGGSWRNQATLTKSTTWSCLSVILTRTRIRGTRSRGSGQRRCELKKSTRTLCRF